MKRFWRLWAKALGEKASPDDREADQISTIRTVLFLHIFVTDTAIVLNIIFHW